ncbi:MAG: hypothetical protein ACI39E_08395 [Acutalibacteraceae bacterium]
MRGKQIFLPLLVILFCGLLACPVRAQEEEDWSKIYEEQLVSSGADELYEQLPQDTKALLQTFGITGLSEQIELVDPQTVLSALADLVSQRAGTPLSSASLLLGTLLLLALVSSAQEGLSTTESMKMIFGAVAALAVSVSLLVPLWQTVQRVQAAAQSASVFSLSFAPVYAAVMTAQGNTLSAASYQAVMLAASQGVSLLISSAILPLLTVSLSLGAAGALNPGLRIGEAGALLNKIAVWLLAIGMTVFVGLLSLQTFVGASADSVGGRALRFSVASLIPVVGGSLSEALYTVRGCLSVLRGSLGGFGILCTALIVLPTLIECAIWSVCLFLCKSISELFSLSAVSSVSGIAQSVVKTMIGVLSANALLMIVSLTALLLAGGG